MLGSEIGAQSMGNFDDAKAQSIGAAPAPLVGNFDRQRLLSEKYQYLCGTFDTNARTVGVDLGCAIVRIHEVT